MHLQMCWNGLVSALLGSAVYQVALILVGRNQCTALYKIMGNLSLAASVGQYTGINSVSLLRILFMAGFEVLHGNQLSILKIVPAHLTHL